MHTAVIYKCANTYTIALSEKWPYVLMFEARLKHLVVVNAVLCSQKYYMFPLMLNRQVGI